MSRGLPLPSRCVSYRPTRVSPQDILEGCISPLTLTSYAGWVLDRMTASSAQAAAPSSSAPGGAAPHTDPAAQESSASACEGPAKPSAAARSEAKVAPELRPRCERLRGEELSQRCETSDAFRLRSVNLRGKACAVSAPCNVTGGDTMGVRSVVPSYGAGGGRLAGKLSCGAVEWMNPLRTNIRSSVLEGFMHSGGSGW